MLYCAKDFRWQITGTETDTSFETDFQLEGGQLKANNLEYSTAPGSTLDKNEPKNNFSLFL